ncbi:MAG: FKBP-type peptidyl-prolyl cis-trans isomerase [Cyclobacteriaceae bacterium]
MKTIVSIKKTGFLLWVSALIIASGCMDQETEYEKQIKIADQALEAYLLNNGINATKSSQGYYFERLEENATGREVHEGDMVSIHFWMTNLDGDLIDFSAQSKPVRFGHVDNALIPAGLNSGIRHMRTGEKYRFYLPSYLAFGSYSHSKYFKPNENFIIETELVDVKSTQEVFDHEMDSIDSYIDNKQFEDILEFESGLRFKTIQAGNGSKPQANDVVEFYFGRKYLDGQLIEETPNNDPAIIRLNTGRAVPGLEQGLRQMREGESALLIMPSQIAFGASIQVIPTNLRPILIGNRIITTRTMPYSPVYYEVELVKIHR